MRPEFSQVHFRDERKAEGNLARVEERLAPELMKPLASLLAHSPEPDGALNLLDRYLQGAPPEVLAELARHPSAVTYLVAIFGYSGYLAESFLAEPALPIQFALDRRFTKLKSKEDLMQDYARFSTTSPDLWLSAQLARFKRRNYLRLVLKDVLGLSTLGETTLELSALADVILNEALIFCDQELEKRYGQPQYRDVQGRIVGAGFSIVSLGKLGGNELNYSSDIDLLFLYSQDGETSGSSARSSVISNKEYFVRLAHAITRTITQTTPHGQVFRVDLRLRPEGEQGDLAISVKSALEYYEHRARDWELQMLIKARHSAGDARLTREFLHGVDQYVYGSPADFGAIESVLRARDRISKKLRETRGAATLDVKQERGGIRDIEFLSQCLQRLYGGSDPWVRSAGTAHGLRKLNDKGLISDRDYATLTASYEFLRKLEHRLQLDMGQQTHRLPAEAEALDRLARRMDAEAGRPIDSARGSPGEWLRERLQETLAQVNEIYQRVVHPHAAPETRAAFGLQPLPALPADRGPHSFASTLTYLDAQAPELAHLVREGSIPDRARQSVVRLIGALLSSSGLFGLARQQPHQLRRALEVVGASPFLAEALIHHPEDLSALDSGESLGLAAPAYSQMRMEMGVHATLRTEPFPWVTEDGLEIREKLSLLRRHYRSQTLALAAADLAGLQPVYASLDRWSVLAARSVASALSIAAQALEAVSPAVAAGAASAAPGFGSRQREALPVAESQSPPRSAADPGAMPFVVLALGRLGLNEFDLGSDADLIFVVADPVHEASSAAQEAAARNEIARWTRLAEKVIEILSSYTRDGSLFPVDTRLRPRGQEGELVVTESGLLSYLSEAAQAWEALTYLKALPVAGNTTLGVRIAERLSARVRDRFGSHPDLEGEVQRMRRRLERELAVTPSDPKTAPGGYYDIDFCVSYLRLRHNLALPLGANLVEQIAALHPAGLMSAEDAQALSAGGVFLRSVDHAIRLVTGKPAQGLPEHVGQAECVENLVRKWGLLKVSEREGREETLPKRLRDVQQQVRYVYRRLVGSE
jgi:[glutamine synthetase] adenylyltransferase / [glutamine synthetase]-adenylyl-L-tyrosine phosphorylase